MTKKSFKVLLAAAVMGTSSYSNADTMSNVPVILGSGCDTRLVIPEGSGGYIPSGDCKTMFVLPHVTGKVEPVSFVPGTHTMLCGAVEDYESGKREAQAIVKKLIAQLGNTSSESRRRDINKRIEDLKRQADAGSSFLNGKQGAIAQLLFTHSIEQEDIFKWYNANLFISHEKGIQFERAPIGNSTLSFSMPKVDEINEDFLLSADIPNLIKKEENGIRTVPFNGSLSGQVIFSLYGACALIDSTPKNLAEVRKVKLNQENLGAFLVANRTFEVQTLSQMSYEASVKKNDFIEIYNRFVKTRSSDFKIDEFVSRNGKGKITELINFEAKVDKMSEAQLDQWNELKATLMNEVALRLSTRMMRHIESLGFLNIKEETVDEAPAPGVVYVDGMETRCSSKSIFGVRISGGCRTYSIKIPRNADGQAKLIDDQSMSTELNISETMTITQPYSYLYTSSFVPVVK